MRMVLKWELGLEARKRCHPQRKTRRDEPVTLGAAPTRGCLFGTEGGTRTAYIFFDLDDPALIPVIAEPLFQELQSKVEFIPVMNQEDLQRGLANIREK
jgi:hypothetical protein